MSRKGIVRIVFGIAVVAVAGLFVGRAASPRRDRLH